MRWLQNWELYKHLNMKHKTILPDEGFPARPVELSPGLTFDVYCMPKGRGKHRVFAQCTCGLDIPFGRMHQHYRTHAPLQEGVERFRRGAERGYTILQDLVEAVMEDDVDYTDAILALIPQEDHHAFAAQRITVELY